MFAVNSRCSTLLLLLLLALGLATATGPATARDLSGSWGLGMQGGVVKLVEGEWDYSNLDQFVALHLDRGLSKRWNLQASFFYGTVRPGVDGPYESAYPDRDIDAGMTFHSGSALYTVMTRPSIFLQHRFKACITCQLKRQV